MEVNNGSSNSNLPKYKPNYIQNYQWLQQNELMNVIRKSCNSSIISTSSSCACKNISTKKKKKMELRTNNCVSFIESFKSHGIWKKIYQEINKSGPEKSVTQSKTKLKHVKGNRAITNVQSKSAKKTWFQSKFFHDW